MFSINSINSIVSGKLVSANNPNQIIAQLAIDSRNIVNTNQCLFIALPSTTRDGHSFLMDAYQKGVRNFLIQNKHKKDLAKLTNANIIGVSSTLQALQQIAVAHRQQFNIPIIGITGSNGKTIVKEWLNQLLKQDDYIVRSPKSYNSQIGVPLSVWNMEQSHTLAIFEAGISLPNEMEQLADIINPTIGIITNIGTAHNEGFNNDLTFKLKEKIKLFKNCNTIIFNNANEAIRNEIQTLYHNRNLIHWGIDKNSVVKITKQTINKGKTNIDLIYNKQKFKFTLPFYDVASIENIMHCICLLLYKRYSEQQINKRLQLLQPVALRLEQKSGINNCILINDSYSNDIDSLSIALETTQQWAGKRPIAVVLTDLEQTGLDNAQLYKSVSDLLKQHKVAQVVAIGKEIKSEAASFSSIKNIHFFDSTTDAKKYLLKNTIDNKAILFKGARSFQLEQIVQALEEKVHQTVLEVNLTNLLQNVKSHQQLLKTTTKIMAIVKAFGYGSGSIQVADVLQKAGIQYLAVAYTDEGVTLRKAGIHLPIMVMNVEPETYDALINYNLEPEIFSIESLRSFLNYAERNALSKYPIHLKLDTGMHRLGFEQQHIAELCHIVSKQNTLIVQTIFSHLVGSDSKIFDDFTNEQNTLFTQMAAEIETALGYTTLHHIANTGGIQRHPKLQKDMVRLGIGMYGVSANKKLTLQPVASLKATIAQIKNVSKNQTVGYNKNGVLKRNSKIATIRIGYADGYSRSLGNGNGKVLINNQLAPTIGNICMDMTMIDITNITDVQVGDYVTLFGANPTIDQLAAWSHTISYEILTNINERVKRVYINE